MRDPFSVGSYSYLLLLPRLLQACCTLLLLLLCGFNTQHVQQHNPARHRLECCCHISPSLLLLLLLLVVVMAMLTTGIMLLVTLDRPAWLQLLLQLLLLLWCAAARANHTIALLPTCTCCRALTDAAACCSPFVSGDGLGHTRHCAATVAGTAAFCHAFWPQPGSIQGPYGFCPMTHTIPCHCISSRDCQDHLRPPCLLLLLLCCCRSVLLTHGPQTAFKEQQALLQVCGLLIRRQVNHGDTPVGSSSRHSQRWPAVKQAITRTHLHLHGHR
jgi:hypothetical protein